MGLRVSKQTVFRHYQEGHKDNIYKRRNAGPAHPPFLVVSNILHCLRKIGDIGRKPRLNNLIRYKGSNRCDQKGGRHHKIPVAHRKHLIAWIDHLRRLG